MSLSAKPADAAVEEGIAASKHRGVCRLQKRRKQLGAAPLLCGRVGCATARSCMMDLRRLDRVRVLRPSTRARA